MCVGSPTGPASLQRGQNFFTNFNNQGFGAARAGFATDLAQSGSGASPQASSSLTAPQQTSITQGAIARRSQRRG